VLWVLQPVGGSFQ